MRLKLHMFASLKDHFPSELEQECREGASAADLLALLGEEKPAARGLLRVTRIAVREELVEPSHLLCNGDEIFLLPPSSGG